METRAKSRLRIFEQNFQQQIIENIIDKCIETFPPNILKRIKQEPPEEPLLHPDEIQCDPVIEEIIRNKKIKVECED
jgi:hypothetical protein